MSNIASVSRFASQVAVAVPLQVAVLPTAVTQSILAANWAKGVTVENAYMTDVTQSSVDVAEERRGLIDRPVRSMSFLLSSMDRSEATKLLIMITQIADERVTFPLFPDVSLVTVIISSSTTIMCDTSDRRFFVGAQVVIMSHDLATSNYKTITQIFSDRLIVGNTITGPFAVGSLVFPTITAEIDLSSSASVITDAVVNLTLKVTEVVGPSTLPGLAWDVPPTFPTFLGDPVFNIDPNWGSAVNVSVLRAGSLVGRGRGVAVHTRGTRPQYEFAMVLTSLDRAAYTRVGQFLDSRHGRLKPFWFVNPQVLFKPAGTWTTSQVQAEPVQGIDTDTIGAFFERLAIVMKDGTIHLPEIDTALTSTFLEIDLLDTIPLITDLSTVLYVTSAHFVRFTNDSWSEKWWTNTVCEVAFVAREILGEVSVAIANLDDSPILTGITSVSGVLFWFDASHGLLDASGAVASDQEAAVLWNMVPGTSPKSAQFITATNKMEVSTPTWTRALDPDPLKNNGRFSLLADTAIMDLNMLFLKFTFYQEVAQGPDTGFTMIICAYDLDGGAAGSNNYLFFYEGVFEWDTTEAKFYEVFNVDVANNNVTYTQIDITAFEPHVLVARYDPGVACEVWDAGVSLGAAVTPVTSLAISTRIVSDPGFQARVELGDCKLNSLTHYNRALSDAEINTVAGSIANLYNGKWVDI